MAHLMSVAALVLEHGGDEDEAIAGLLHDAPEDQGGQETLDDIRRRILEDYRRIGDQLWKRFAGKRDGTLWYYGELLKIYREKAPARCTDLVEEMERLHRELGSVVGSEPRQGIPSRL